MGFKIIKKPPTYVLVETVGVEPTSKGIATQASTRIVGILSFTGFSAYQQASKAASLVGFNCYPQTADTSIARLI